MDLVSSTLDKYLKHRFNGTVLLENDNSNQTKSPIGTNIQMKVPKLQENNTAVNSPPSDTQTTKQESNILSDDPNTCSQMKPSENRTNDSTTAPIPNELQGDETEHSVLEVCSNQIVTNGISEHDNQLPITYYLSLRNTRPCCVSLKDDLHYLAAGFENSHIYLWKFNDGDASFQNTDTMFPLIAHSGSVYGIEFFNQNDLMLSCSEDTTIRLWCLKTKCNVYIYRGHNYPIWSITIGSQENMFASASMDATSRLWQLDRMTPIRIFCGHDDDVECVKFHPNGKYIATGSSDATVRLWSTSDGKMVRLMVGHESSIISLSFLPNGKFLASTSRDGIIKIWNLATNCVSKELSVFSIISVSFSPEQQFIATCGLDNILRLWHSGDAKIVSKKKFDDKPSTLIYCKFHRNNKLYVIGYTDDEKM